MNERQLIAFEDPSARAYDTLNKKFFRVIKAGGHVYSTILSVNK